MANRTKIVIFNSFIPSQYKEVPRVLAEIGERIWVKLTVWAATLNGYKYKKIIMPKSWYMNGYIQTKDLYPENCIVI